MFALVSAKCLGVGSLFFWTRDSYENQRLARPARRVVLRCCFVTMSADATTTFARPLYIYTAVTGGANGIGFINHAGRLAVGRVDCLRM